MAAPQAFDEFIVSIGRDTWDTFRREPLMLVVAWLVVVAVSLVSLGLLAGVVSVGYIELIRQSRRGEPVALGVLFSRFDSLVSSALAGFLVFVAVFIGMFLLVLPGLLVALFACFTLHAIAYERVSGIEAIRRSFAVVRANFLNVLVLLLAISVAQAVGGMVVFGVLLTGPLSLIALTLGYERIAGAPVVQTLTI
jgi:uncharacterized membrane protein